ncbi:hypothetical protein [Chondrinema litorale]|uniref:hypothetical protein n=1 Tax=Chondrinema litorale TaxID=2994555 RepID=UPI00254315BF|nr:hypothetical protein [Chondrinema litorale]UZR99571.1 hypothetical protein OQ292_37550 [Chondrinema litorale]
MTTRTILYSSQFLKMNYYQSDSLLEVVWQPATKLMAQADYQECFYSYINIRKKYNIDKVLLDERQMLFTPSTMLINWASSTLNTNLQIKPSQIAIVMNHEFVQQLLLKLLIEEVSKDSSDYLFFINRDDAIQWLVEDIIMDGYQVST